MIQRIYNLNELRVALNKLSVTIDEKHEETIAMDKIFESPAECYVGCDDPNCPYTH